MEDRKTIHTAIQLELLPLRKYFRQKSYTLITAELEAERAREIAEELRKNGLSVQLRKDKEGKYDIKDAYLVWARLKT